MEKIAIKDETSAVELRGIIDFLEEHTSSGKCLLTLHIPPDTPMETLQRYHQTIYETTTRNKGKMTKKVLKSHEKAEREFKKFIQTIIDDEIEEKGAIVFLGEIRKKGGETEWVNIVIIPPYSVEKEVDLNFHNKFDVLVLKEIQSQIEEIIKIRCVAEKSDVVDLLSKLKRKDEQVIYGFDSVKMALQKDEHRIDKIYFTTTFKNKKHCAGCASIFTGSKCPNCKSTTHKLCLDILEAELPKHANLYLIQGDGAQTIDEKYSGVIVTYIYVNKDKASVDHSGADINYFNPYTVFKYDNPDINTVYVPCSSISAFETEDLPILGDQLKMMYVFADRGEGKSQAIHHIIRTCLENINEWKIFPIYCEIQSFEHQGETETDEGRLEARFWHGLLTGIHDAAKSTSKMSYKNKEGTPLKDVTIGRGLTLGALSRDIEKIIGRYLQENENISPKHVKEKLNSFIKHVTAEKQYFEHVLFLIDEFDRYRWEEVTDFLTGNQLFFQRMVDYNSFFLFSAQREWMQLITTRNDLNYFLGKQIGIPKMYKSEDVERLVKSRCEIANCPDIEFSSDVFQYMTTKVEHNAREIVRTMHQVIAKYKSGKLRHNRVSTDVIDDILGEGERASLKQTIQSLLSSRTGEPAYKIFDRLMGRGGDYNDLLLMLCLRSKNKWMPYDLDEPAIKTADEFSFHDPDSLSLKLKKLQNYGVITKNGKFSPVISSFIEHVQDEHGEKTKKTGGAAVVGDIIDTIDALFSEHPDLGEIQETKTEDAPPPEQKTKQMPQKQKQKVKHEHIHELLSQNPWQPLEGIINSLITEYKEDTSEKSLLDRLERYEKDKHLLVVEWKGTKYWAPRYPSISPESIIKIRNPQVLLDIYSMLDEEGNIILKEDNLTSLLKRIVFEGINNLLPIIGESKYDQTSEGISGLLTKYVLDEKGVIPLFFMCLRYDNQQMLIGSTLEMLAYISRVESKIEKDLSLDEILGEHVSIRETIDSITELFRLAETMGDAVNIISILDFNYEENPKLWEEVSETWPHILERKGLYRCECGEGIISNTEQEKLYHERCFETNKGYIMEFEKEILIPSDFKGLSKILKQGLFARLAEIFSSSESNEIDLFYENPTVDGVDMDALAVVGNKLIGVVYSEWVYPSNVKRNLFKEASGVVDGLIIVASSKMKETGRTRTWPPNVIIDPKLGFEDFASKIEKKIREEAKSTSPNKYGELMKRKIEEDE